MTKEEVLKKYWGYDNFRTQQAEIIQSVIDGYDTLALLPTGGGKSLCFQIPAIIRPGICVVVSPLIALMKDQVATLRKLGLKAHGIFSGMTQREIDIALDNCIYGDTQFLYISPERLGTELFQVRFAQMNVALLAIDEAHCISQWGYDFRPAYHEISTLREVHPTVPIIALTASATNEVRKDIIEKLELRRPSIFKKSFSRKNLSYSVFKTESKTKKLLSILENVKGSGIVYTQTRKETQEISRILNNSGISADYYHAGLSHNERTSKQEAWLSGLSRIIVATNAFGMGIDKPNVRVVVNYGPSASLEAYYQEAGRAGRDEEKAYAVLLYDDFDLELLSEKINAKYPPFDLIRKVYSSLGNLLILAIGSKGKDSYEFDMNSFCENFKLPPVETFHALKLLETEGYISLNENFFSPSKVKINVSNADLYDYQIRNENHEKFIKTLLRHYGGELYSSYLFINELKFGRSLAMSEPEVVSTLQHLHTHGIIDYKERKDKPQVSFLQPRVDSSKMKFDFDRIEFLKSNQLQKVAAITEYANEELKCRTQIICEYFDEKNTPQCGVCDNCLKAKRLKTIDFKPHIPKALVLLKEEKTTEELKKELKISIEEAEQLVSYLLREEKIKITLKGKLIEK